jgi:RNA polymerase sigma-70 factor (ECF subfamily)
MAVPELVEAFRAALPTDRRADVTDAVASLVAAAIVAGRTAWPAIDVTDGDLAAFLAARLKDGDLAEAILAAPAADLLLACGCAAGKTTALAAFETVLAEVDAAGRTARAASDLVDEVKQKLRTTLLVADGDKPPGIVAYRGKGSLRGWIRVTATRELVRLEQKARRAQPLEDAVLDEPQGDPAIEGLKARYRAELAAAIKEAIGRLNADDRTLLRHHLIDRLSIDELGARYSVHRATAARWLARARAALVAATQTELAVRMRLAADEVSSVIRMVSSRLDASLVGVLGEDGDDDTRHA